MTLLPCPLQMIHLSSSGPGTQPTMPAGGQHQPMKKMPICTISCPQSFFKQRLHNSVMPCKVGTDLLGLGLERALRTSPAGQGPGWTESVMEPRAVQAGRKRFSWFLRPQRLPGGPSPGNPCPQGDEMIARPSQPQAPGYRIIHSGFQTSCLSCSSTWRNAASPEPNGADR